MTKTSRGSVAQLHHRGPLNLGFLLSQETPKQNTPPLGPLIPLVSGPSDMCVADKLTARGTEAEGVSVSYECGASGGLLLSACPEGDPCTGTGWVCGEGRLSSSPRDSAVPSLERGPPASRPTQSSISSRSGAWCTGLQESIRLSSRPHCEHHPAAICSSGPRTSPGFGGQGPRVPGAQDQCPSLLEACSGAFGDSPCLGWAHR